jgi:hypothetical protein
MKYFTGKNFIEISSDDFHYKPGVFVGWLLSAASAENLYNFAKLQGVQHINPPEEMHCTIIYSPSSYTDKFGDFYLKMPIELNSHSSPTTRILGKPGSEGALVTTYHSTILANRHRYWRDEKNMQHSYPDFLPHVTLSYNALEQDPIVVKRLINYPCQIPIAFDRERISPLKD